MSLVKDSRCLLKPANCVDDGLSLINCFLTCSESELTSKCFYVWKFSSFYLMFPFFIGYLKKICRGWSHKNAYKNVGVQIESTVKADSMCLAQPVVPLHCRGLSAEKVCSDAKTQKASYRWYFRFLCEPTSIIIKIKMKKIYLVSLSVLPLQDYHPVLGLSFTLRQGESENPSLWFHKFMFCRCWRHFYLVFV